MVSKQPLSRLNLIIETNLSFKEIFKRPFTKLLLVEGCQILLVLRVSLTLFNLQGARRSCGWTFSLSHDKPFVKNFFKFFQLFVRS